MAQAFDFKVAVYINGILFAPRSVGFVAQQGALHQFTVDLPAVFQWDILPARSHGAVFFIDPVIKKWRLMCEGEYSHTERAKQGTGQRFRSLVFRSLHGYWNTTTYNTIASIVTPSNQDTNIVNETLKARAAGRTFIFAEGEGEDEEGNTLIKIPSINALIDEATVGGDKVSYFVPVLLRNMAAQTPIECFYFYHRQLLQKMHTLPDTTITSVINYQMLNGIIKDGWNNYGLGPSAQISSVIAAYEATIFYHHTPIPAPPLLNDQPGMPPRKAAEDAEDVSWLSGDPKFAPSQAEIQAMKTQKATPQPVSNMDKIPEVVFIPHLYACIPPVCNIIFADQVVNASMSRAFLDEPSRVISQLSTGMLGDFTVPVLYMANDVTQATAVVEPETDPPAPFKTTHSLLSEEELMRGVNPVTRSLGLEKLGLDQIAEQSQNPEATLQGFIESATRHEYMLARGEVRTCSLVCTFLPYLVPGFPCLVEDSTGPFFGMISSVQHSMPCQGQPVTSVMITHMREAYILEGKNRTSPIPVWLNEKFRPTQINQTYKELLKIGDTDARKQQSAMAPDSEINNDISNASIDQPTMVAAQTAAGLNPNDPNQTGDQYLTAASDSVRQVQDFYLKNAQPNFDALASQVVGVPTYSSMYEMTKAPGIGSTIAARLRRFPSPELAFLQFQYREGVLLSEFISFHNLQGNREQIDEVFTLEELPEDLNPDQKNGHPLFGSPTGMDFVGQTQLKDPNSIYGIYTLAKGDGSAAAGQSVGISIVRQKAARTIKQAINRMISPT